MALFTNTLSGSTDDLTISTEETTIHVLPLNFLTQAGIYTTLKEMVVSFNNVFSSPNQSFDKQKEPFGKQHEELIHITNYTKVIK